MARKAETFKVNTDKQTITIYTNVEAVEAEKALMEFYLKQCYAPLFEEKKPTKTVKEMEAELKKNDAEAYAKFEEAYKQKNGFFNACKIYSDWKKNNRKKK